MVAEGGVAEGGEDGGALELAAHRRSVLVKAESRVLDDQALSLSLGPIVPRLFREGGSLPPAFAGGSLDLKSLPNC